MDRAAEFIQLYLSHYASEYYDPTKAHEYYLKTRELTGRQSSSDLKTKEKKQAWSYAKSQLSEKKKGELAASSEARKAVVEQAREAAKAKREEISEKIQALLKTISDKRSQVSDKISEDKKSASENISNTLKRETQRIADETARKIDALPPIPKGVSQERRSELAAERSAEIAKIRGNAQTEKNTLNSQAANARSILAGKTQVDREALGKFSEGLRGKAQDDGSAQREAITTGLKKTVDTARASYNAARESLKAKYEQASQKEFEAIKRNV